MQSNHFAKAALLTLGLVVAFFAGWEIFLRSKGMSVSYDDGKESWAYQRARVYAPADEATVFIGSSRIKFDLDIPTWEKRTGEKAVQLAKQGNSPLPVLDDLAADENFKGKLIIDVTEGLFFSSNPANNNEPRSYVTYYKKQTPAEKASFQLDHALESGLVFLDRENYSLNALLERVRPQNRTGVFSFPIFPPQFDQNSFERQSFMTDQFVADTNLHRKVTDIWMYFASLRKEPPASGATLDSFFTVVKKDVDRIRARGGQVIFVRTPSSGPYWQGEQHGFPREKYWDRLLAVTNTPGIHFKDYPALDHFVCPEWSHLTPKDAVSFTENLIPALEEKGWRFPSQKLALR
jgi:hypothetical protein